LIFAAITKCAFSASPSCALPETYEEARVPAPQRVRGERWRGGAQVRVLILDDSLSTPN
jgi:hypothetical protein